MDCNLIFFASPETLNLVRDVRKRFGFENQTDLRPIEDWASMPFSKLMPQMYSAVINSFPRHFSELFTAGLPEHLIPEYDLINVAKVKFLRYAIEQNPFESDFFFWMDSGAGHGETAFFDQWCPCTAAIRQKVTLLSGPPEPEQPLGVSAKTMTWEKYFSKHFTEHMYSPVGSAWGGDKSTILQFEKEFSGVLDKILNHDLIDDDQPMLALSYMRKPELFRLMPGNSHSFVKMC